MTDLLPLPDPTDPAQRAAAVRAAAARSAHPDVLAHIRDHVATEAQERSLNALSRGVAVVTGQQAGLFGGPLYTLHKAAAAIANARSLEAETGVPCAPVFWLQDEDHDFDEIRTATLLGADGELHSASIDGMPEEAGRSVWARRMGPSVHAALATLEAAVEGLPFADEVAALHCTTHSPDTSPSTAFRAVMERLFAPHGLLFVDPTDPALIDAARPVHQRAIDQAEPIARALQLQADAMARAGQPVPVHIRPGAPLSFVHPDGLEGPRFRAVPTGDGHFELVGAGRPPLALDALLAAAHSTSALLRPILQDHWLPTAAYVGGPGELAYLAQMPPLWAAFDLPTPLVVLRARFVIVDAPSRKLLDRLGLRPDDLEQPPEDLMARLGHADGAHTAPDALLAALTVQLPAMRAFVDEARALEHTLGKSAARTLGSMEYTANKIVDRYRRTLARQDDVLTSRLQRLRQRLRPHDAPQERVHAWPTYGARFGIDAFVQSILGGVVPFDGTLQELSL